MSLFAFYYLQYVAIYIILGWAVYLPFRMKQLYFGAIYSMCIGAYFTGFATRDLNWPFWLALVGAAVLCALFSMIFAPKLAPLPVFPIVLATIALVFIIQTVFRNLEFLGGGFGFYNIPFVPSMVLLGTSYGLALIIGYFIYRIDHSHIGMAMEAIYHNQDEAQGLGIDTTKLSIQLQVISSAMGGLAGGLYALTNTAIYPDSFDFFLINYIVAIVIVGGSQTMWGVIVVSPIVLIFNQLVPQEVQRFANIIYSVCIIVVLILRPSGLINKKTVLLITTKAMALVRRFTGSKNYELP